MQFPKNEAREENVCNDNGELAYVITRHNVTKVFHLYKIENNKPMHIKQRSKDPFFKETHPERYQ